MKIIKNNEELKSYIKDGTITFNENIRCDFDIKVEADINARNINALNINALNIDARNINAWNINALNINAWNINAWNINAHDVSYYAFCIANQTLKCKSIEGKRSNSIHKCLDKNIEYIKDNTELEALEKKHRELGEEIQKLKNKQL